MTITQKFLSIFGGKWYKYGHWSMMLIIGSHASLVLIVLTTLNMFLCMAIGYTVGWLAMLALELAQHYRKGDTGFNWGDIRWNTIAYICAGVFTLVLLAVYLWTQIEIY